MSESFESRNARFRLLEILATLRKAVLDLNVVAESLVENSPITADDLFGLVRDIDEAADGIEEIEGTPIGPETIEGGAA